MKVVNSKLFAVFLIALSVVYQVHCAIHGFDLTDEGYLMSIYQWFATDPAYAQGAGGYPLTAHWGSLLHGWLQGGILGMRLSGILIVALTEVVLYFYLRRTCNASMALIGIVIQAVFVAQDPKPFGYNTLTALIGFVALIIVMEGSLRHRFVLLLIGGFLLGVNVFVRLPNITGLAFLLIPIVANVSRKDGFEINTKRALLQVSMLLVGFVVALTLTWQYIIHLGADQQVIDLIYSIRGTLAGTSTHGSGSMIQKYLGNYSMAIWFSLVFFITVIIGALSLKSRWKVVTLAGLVVAFMVLYRNTYMLSNVLGDNILALMNGLGIIGACCYLNKDVRMQVLATTAILSSLVFPLGSDGGFQTMWIGTWLLLPVGLSGIYSFLSAAATSNTTATLLVGNGNTSASHTRLSLSAKNLQAGYFFALLVLVFTVVVKIEHMSYYDPGNRLTKTTAIHSQRAQGVYTSKERADIVNPLLDELKKHVKPGDVMLVYDSSPLLYYLTETRPFAGISWPCVFHGQPYVQKFVAAEKESKQLPVVVMQYFVSSNKWSDALTSYYLLPEEGGFDKDGMFSSKEMKLNIRRFISAHDYQVVWTNDYYKIFIPNRN